MGYISFFQQLGTAIARYFKGDKFNLKSSKTDEETLKAYLGLCQISMMEHFAIITNS